MSFVKVSPVSQADQWTNGCSAGIPRRAVDRKKEPRAGKNRAEQGRIHTAISLKSRATGGCRDGESEGKTVPKTLERTDNNARIIDFQTARGRTSTHGFQAPSPRSFLQGSWFDLSFLGLFCSVKFNDIPQNTDENSWLNLNLFSLPVTK